ncbi:MAG: NAD(P)H-binding protein [Chloroflexota bacterium]
MIEKSMATNKQNRVLVTGGGSYLGLHIAAALLAEGADVSLIIRTGNEERLGLLANRVHWMVADVWDSAALKGRARGHQTVIHTVGSMVADAAQGLTYDRLNLVSARNVANMCVSDGVNQYILLSTVRAPWVTGKYVKAKHAAEDYVRRIGLTTSIVRAPITYTRGSDRPFFYRMMTALGSIPPLTWTHIGRMAPMPLDVLARGIARTALNPPERTRILYSGDMRRLNTRDEMRGSAPEMKTFDAAQDTITPFENLDDATPFGWIPTQPRNDE